MKKAIGLLLALLMVVGLAACGETASSSDPASTGSTVSTGGTASAGDETSTGESSTPAFTDTVITASTKDNGNTPVYEMVWNSTQNTLMMTSIEHTDEESAKWAEISGAYDERSVTLYGEVTVTEGADGTQVLRGKRYAIKNLIVGDGAEDCIRQTRNWREGQIKQGLDISLNQLYIRLLDGETLTDKEMERITRRLDVTIELTLRGSGEDAEIVEFTESYTDYDNRDTTRKIVRKLQDGALHIGERYTNGTLVWHEELRTDGTLEKVIQYSGGTITRVTEYDENNKEIRDTQYDENGNPIEE